MIAGPTVGIHFAVGAACSGLWAWQHRYPLPRDIPLGSRTSSAIQLRSSLDCIAGIVHNADFHTAALHPRRLHTGIVGDVEGILATDPSHPISYYLGALVLASLLAFGPLGFLR